MRYLHLFTIKFFKVTATGGQVGYNILRKHILEVCIMTLAEKLLKEFQELPEEKKQQVIDFVEFLKSKQQKEIEVMIDEIIDTNKEALLELAK